MTSGGLVDGVAVSLVKKVPLPHATARRSVPSIVCERIAKRSPRTWSALMITSENSERLGKKAHQLSVHLLGMGPQHAMRTTLELDELDVLQHPRLSPRGRIRWQDPVGIAV